MKTTKVFGTMGRMNNLTKFMVFVSNNPVDDVADVWFSDNKIWELKFESKAWNSMKNTATKISSAKIADHLIREAISNSNIAPEGMKLTYSRKAGCSCGCSPGYIGTLSEVHPYLSGKDFSITDVEMTEEDKKILDVACRNQAAKLIAEIAVNS